MTHFPITECTQMCAANEYFAKRLSNGKYLITTRHRNYAILDSAEYSLLEHWQFCEDTALFKKLERAGVILTERNINNIIQAYEMQYLFLFFPRTYRINLSNECNLACKYCLSNAGADQHETMSDDVMDATINFILSAQGNKFYLEFQGGEPLAKFEDIKKFLEKIRTASKITKKEIDKIVIVTNLTLMNEEIAEYLIRNDISFCSSLDGPETLHDSQRMFGGGRGTYRTVIKWLEYFNARGKTTSLLPTITANSIKYGAKCIIDEYLKWGCIRIPIRPVFPVGRAKNSLLLPSANEFIAFWKEAVEYMVELTINGKTVLDPTIRAMLHNMFNAPMSYMCMRKPCGAAISHVSITHNGKVQTCDLAKTVPQTTIGDVHESYMDVALRTLHMNARTSDFQPLCNTCVYGPYCGSCHARTRSVFSDDVPRTPYDFECKVNRAMFTFLFEKIEDEKYLRAFNVWVRAR